MLYKCKICGEVFSSISEKNECENKVITKNFDLKIGDEILITTGEGNGKIGIIEDIYIISKYWGHYYWQRYWHTVGLNVEVKNSWGNRMLTFDDYELIGKQKIIQQRKYKLQRILK